MRALIRETEHTEGCRIESRIEPLSADMADLQKRVLFQALQEGLSCGLKTGNAHRFEFELSAHEGWVRFLLRMEGMEKAHEGDNLGMRIVDKRVALWGGQLRLQPAAEGAVLFVTIPESA